MRRKNKVSERGDRLRREEIFAEYKNEEKLGRIR